MGTNSDILRVEGYTEMAAWYGERPTEKYQAYLFKDQLKTLRAMSASSDVPVAALIRRAIDSFITESAQAPKQ